MAQGDEGEEDAAPGQGDAARPRRSATPRDVLNELKWRHGVLLEVRVVYRHRGAPGDEAVLAGERIEDLGASFIAATGRFGGLMLPYHRVLRIEHAGRVVWARKGPAPPGDGGNAPSEARSR